VSLKIPLTPSGFEKVTFRLLAVIAIIFLASASKLSVSKYFGCWCTFIFKFMTVESPHCIITALCLMQISTLKDFLICYRSELKKIIVIWINNLYSEDGISFLLSCAKQKLTSLCE
jgi:hypothetical protein